MRGKNYVGVSKNLVEYKTENDIFLLLKLSLLLLK